MNWLDQLERRFGKFAVPGITRIVVAFNAIVYILIHANENAIYALTLDPQKVMQGEAWRLVTFLFIPSTLDPIWLFFALYFLWIIGDGLEQEWGAFKLNMFYLAGMIATAIVAFFIVGGSVSNSYLNLSLFFAFATLFPDFEVLLFFILPIKVKWLAAVSAAFVVWSIIADPLSAKLAAIVSLGNYLLFFGPHFFRTAVLKTETLSRKAEFEAKSRDASEPWHRCAVCGRTERDDANLEFRVADDDREYCTEHLPR